MASRQCARVPGFRESMVKGVMMSFSNPLDDTRTLKTMQLPYGPHPNGNQQLTYKAA